MNILMVTSEAVPFSKSGGLADVVGALPPALVKAGASVRVYMPMYSFINTDGFEEDNSFTVPMLSGDEEIRTVRKTVSGVEYIGVVHPYFTDRKGIYGDTSFTPYSDNAPRFILFAKSVAYYLKASRNKADVVHCHDWTTGLVPFYLKKARIRSKSVFTIHNLAYQGEFSRYDAILSGDVFTEDSLSGAGMDRRLNMIQSGIMYADKITTVSPTYAEEIQTPELGCGLDRILKHRQRSLYGIINGMDINEWNPETDVYFSEHYTKDNLSGKRRLKSAVLKENNLSGEDLPLISMISRIADQKGYPELMDGIKSALDEILDMPLNMIIIGSGDRKYEEKLKETASVRSNLSVHITFSNSLAHRIEGASDFFLMPSRYEPCGLNQMYSLRYGTLPIAHRTGGLADTIVDIDDGMGDGILFDNLSSFEIVKAVKRALLLWDNSDKMVMAVDTAMGKDFSWDASARSYMDLYGNRI